MLKIFGFIAFFLFISLTFPETKAQSVSELEAKYSNVSKNLKYEIHILDSLKILLNEKADQIDFEKNKRNTDKDKIVAMMSSSVIISDKYDLQQKKVRRLKDNLESIGKVLSNKYSSIIDSIQSLQKSGKFTNSKDELDSEILLYLEKKLALAPRITLLSFDPAELLKIKPDKTKDSLGYAIYREYLQSAYDELNTQLAEISEQYSEINDIMHLQTKTEKFLKEAEFESGIRTDGSSPDKFNNNGTRGGSFSDPNSPTENLYMMEQLRGYSLLLDQLTLDLSSGQKIGWQVESIDGNTSISLKQYKKVLEELMEKLEEYRLVLGNKINSYSR